MLFLGEDDVAGHFADRLLGAIEDRGAPACVGFDPLVTKLPAALRVQFGLEGDQAGESSGAFPVGPAIEAIEAFGRGVIEVVAEHVPAIKINIAFFEPLGEGGLGAYGRLVHAAHDAGLLVIGDIKRADIGHSTEAYARAHLAGDRSLDGGSVADAVTVNPYFGSDGVRPFVDAARANGRGVFVLVQTSNPSAAELQGVETADGRLFVEHVAELVEGWAAERGVMGSAGYSCVGAVVSPRDAASTERIRTLMPSCVFLVPGFGAQGRTADEVARCFQPDGRGGLVTASRSVIYTFDEAQEGASGPDWKTCVARACGGFVEQIRQVLKRR